MSTLTHLPPITTDSRTLPCQTCRQPWPCDGWRERVSSPHAPSLVLELINRAPNYGEFCLKCSLPWPCPGAESEPT